MRVVVAGHTRIIVDESHLLDNQRRRESEIAVIEGVNRGAVRVAHVQTLVGRRVAVHAPLRHRQVLDRQGRVTGDVARKFEDATVGALQRNAPAAVNRSRFTGHVQRRGGCNRDRRVAAVKRDVAAGVQHCSGGVTEVICVIAARPGAVCRVMSVGACPRRSSSS
ncbi:MAG: hypothetical protein HC828_08965 [Blastochloris sp.]|nr:hypothetical protein [Blastochloris sp.]